eukprot:2852050-Pyramimonas_sp.AAC.1
MTPVIAERKETLSKQGGACRPSHWGLRLSTLYGVTKRARGVRNWARGRMWALSLGPSVKPPHGATTRARGAPTLALGR